MKKLSLPLLPFPCNFSFYLLRRRSLLRRYSMVIHSGQENRLSGYGESMLRSWISGGGYGSDYGQTKNRSARRNGEKNSEVRGNRKTDSTNPACSEVTLFN